MSRITKVAPEQASDALKPVYAAINASLGGVPNLFQTLGVNPTALAAYLSIGKALGQNLLSKEEKAALALVTAQTNGCNYCLAAHTVLGKMAGLSEAEMIAARKSGSEDRKRAALMRFASEFVTEKGRVSEQTWSSFTSAGFTEAHVPEVVLVIVQNIFTNYFNNFNDTEIDFPAAPKV